MASVSNSYKQKNKMIPIAKPFKLRHICTMGLKLGN